MKTNHPMFYVLCAVAGLTLWQETASAQAGKSKQMYRWVDANGQVHYGDKVPAQDAKQGRETLNERGSVTKVVPRELHGAELQAAQAKLAQEKAAKEAIEQRATYDRYLLQSFASVADMQAARDERLSALESRISLAQKAVIDNEKTLSDLRSRAGDKAPKGDLKKQIDTFEGSLIDNLQVLRKLKDERVATELKYTADIERFKALRSGAVQQGG